MSAGVSWTWADQASIASHPGNFTCTAADADTAGSNKAPASTANRFMNPTSRYRTIFAPIGFGGKTEQRNEHLPLTLGDGVLKDASMAGIYDAPHLARGPANYAALTPLTFLARAAEVHPDKIAVIH